MFTPAISPANTRSYAGSRIAKAFTAVVVAAAVALPVTVTPASARSVIVGGVPVEASIMRAGARAADIRRIRHVPSVGVVDLRIRYRATRLWLDDDPIAEMRLSVSRNKAGVNRLRAALRANPATRRALAARGIPINRIVAADVFSNGSLRVYIL